MTNRDYTGLNTSTNIFSNALESIEKANRRKKAISNLSAEIDREGVVSDLSNVQPQQVQENIDTAPDANFVERTFGTVWEAIQNVGRGFLGIVEGVVDLSVGAMGEVGSWFGADTKWAEDFVKYDYTNLMIDELDPTKWVTGNKSSEVSYVNELGEKTQNIIRGVEQAIGSSLGAIASAGITGGTTSGLLLYGAGAGGQSFSEALNEGGDYSQSLLYGLASGATEAVIEKSSDVLGNMLGLDIGAIPGLQKFGTKGLKNVVGSFFSEGLEEVISDVINPSLKSIYNGKTLAENYKEGLTPAGLFETFIVGAISGGIMTGTTEVVRNVAYSPEGKAIQNEMIDINKEIEDAYIEYQNTEQTTAEEQLIAYEKYEKIRENAKQKYESLKERTEKLADKYQNKLKSGLENLEKITKINSTESSIYDVVDKLNTTRNSNEQLNVNFVDDKNVFNGKIEGNTIYLSKNPTKALRQVLTHEISHTLETNNEYKDMMNKIYEQVSETEDFKKSLKWAKETYKNQSEDIIKNEAITEYIANNFFKSYKDISQAFENKSMVDKFKNMIKGIRKESRNSKVRDEYLKLLNKLSKTKIKENKNIEKLSKKGYNENTEKGGLSDDFRRIQEESRNLSNGEQQLFNRGSKRIDEGLRTRLSTIYKREIISRSNSSRNGNALVINKNNFKVLEVDGTLFHDIFEINKKYLLNGELVDLHDSYNDSTCYLSNDGLSGFAITKSGDLISVFNLSEKRGFLNSISSFIKSNAKTLDCYNSPLQPLAEIYTHKLGFKTASIMDYNMDFDHDNIAKNHNSPQVAFMVNTTENVETKHFDKNQYDKAVAYQQSFFAKYSLKDTDTQIDNFNKKIEDLNITLVDNVGDVKNTIKSIAQYKGSELVRQKKKMNALTRELSNAIRINDVTLEQYYYNNFDISNQTFQEFKDSIVDMVADNILSDVKQLGDNVKINKLIDRMINNLVKEVNILKTMNTRSRKVTSRLNNIRHWFRDKFGKSKRYSTKKLESLFENTSKELSKLRFTGTGKLEARSRQIINEYGNTFYQSSLVEQFKGDELHREYIKQSLNYIQDRVNYFEGKQKIAGIDTINVLQFADTNPLSILNGKTEAEIIADILEDARRILNAGNNKTVQWQGEYQSPKELAQNEIANQLNIVRSTNRFAKFLRQSTIFTGILDMESVMNIWSGAKQDSLFKQMYSSLRNGRDKTYSIYYDLSKDINNYAQDNKKTLKSLDKEIDFLGNKITKGQAVGLILTSETDNALSHLVGDGITIENGNGNSIDITGDKFLNTLSEEEFETYKNAKTDSVTKNELAQKAVDNVINQLKTDLGTELNDFMQLLREMYSKATQYYVDASDEVLGFHYEPKKIFYPTNVSSYSFRTELGNIDTNSSFVKDIFNPSFTKATTKGSKNTLKIGDALFTATSFMHALSNFAGTTIEVKNINKILNAKVKIEGYSKPITLIEYMDKNVDKNFSKKMNRLFLAMQGINTSQQTFVSKGLKYLRSVNAKYNLGANGKVIVSQFLSYPMAANDLKYSSLVKGLGSKRNFASFDYLIERSPYTRNRYQENNLYNAESVGAIGNTLNTISEWTMKPIKGMDKFTLNTLWKACQAEVGFSWNDTSDIQETKLAEAIKLFEDVAQRTQPQYDPLNNGDLTRISGQGSEILRSIFMFTSVPRKYLSRLVESFYNVFATKKGTIEHQNAARQLAKTMSGFMASTVAMTLLTSLLKSLKGDFDDKEKDEIIAEIFKDDFATNIVGLIPFMKNIYGHIVNGYDLDLINLPQLEESIDLVFKELPIILNTNTTDGERRATLWRITQTICKLTGVPVKNVYNDIQYVLGAFDKRLVLKMNNLFYNTSDNALSTMLKSYKDKGQEKKVAAVIEVKLQKTFSSKLKDASYNELARLYMNDSLSSLPKSIGETISVNGEEKELTKATRTKMQNIYNLANQQLDNLIKQQYYLSLSDEEKALAIKKLYDTYYDYAKSNAIGGDTTTKLATMLNYIDINKMVSILAKTSKLNTSNNSTRKSLVSGYIDKQRLSKAEKYLAFMLSGYSLNDENKKLVSNYLVGKGMKNKQVQNIF